MSREFDSEEIQAQYRGGCGVDSISSDTRIPSSLPEEAYLLEEGSENDFPENPKAAIPNNSDLRELETEDVVTALSEVLQQYADRLRAEENVEELVRVTGESRDMIKFDINMIERFAEVDVLYDWLVDGETDLGNLIDDWQDASGYFERAAPLGRGVNINAGHNIGAVIIPEIWRVLSRNSVLHKMPSNDQVTLRILHNLYKEIDNPIANTCKIGYWPGGSTELEENLFSTDYVMAWGDDSTVESIQSKVSPTTRFVPFHFEFGAYLVDAATQENYEEKLLNEIVKDFSWGDQLLCFSPLIMVVEESENTDRFLADLAEIMEDHVEKYSMGVVPDSDRINITRTKKIARDSGNLISDWENKTTVIQQDGLESSDIAEFHGFRFIKAHRVDQLEETLDTIGSVRNLQEFILATTEDRRLQLRDRILQTNAKRIVSPGGAPPTIPIPWDGKQPVTQLLKKVTDERPG